MKKQILTIPAIIFFAVLSMFFYLLIIDRNPLEIPSNLLNKNVPKFTTDSLFTESKFSSPQDFNNEITIVNFFATWCKPCRDEHVFIKRLADKKNIKVIGINYKDDEKKTKKWLNELGNPYSNIALDKNGKIAIDWGVYGIPETFIINSDAIIKYRQVGPITTKIYKKFNLILDSLK